MNRGYSRRTIVVLGVVLIVALTGCTGWGTGGSVDTTLEDDGYDGDELNEAGTMTKDGSEAEGAEPDKAEMDHDRNSDRRNDGESDGSSDGDSDTATDVPSGEYDPGQFTFIDITDGDEEERAPHSVYLWNANRDGIDLSGWAIMTSEGGEYVFPEGTVIQGDGTIAAGFEPDELPRDGGTLVLTDADGNVVIEDEYRHR